MGGAGSYSTPCAGAAIDRTGSGTNPCHPRDFPFRRRRVLTQRLIFHVVSGQSFFSGVACLLAAVALSFRTNNRWIRILRNSLVGLGGTLIAASATPFSPWIYLLLFLITVAWLLCELINRDRIRIPLRAITAIAWIAACLFEIPYHFMSNVPPLGHPTLGIIGDSITAGIEQGTVTWPTWLARRYGVVVVDHAVAGATVTSAMNQANAVSTDERLVLLEIGGNDLLGGTSTEDFEHGLDNLLAAVVRPGRVNVMLELPLPPGSNEFGRIQRTIASKYKVLMVPKRVLLGILLNNGATLDSIHLSPDGHQRMAEVLWQVLKGAYRRDEI